MRRLNRREYRNTIEQLTGVKVDVASLPSDGGSGTFDTVGASQFISSDQIEQYLKLGRSAIDELFERKAALAPETKVFRVEPEQTINPENEKEIANIEDEYARFTRRGKRESMKPRRHPKIRRGLRRFARRIVSSTTRFDSTRMPTGWRERPIQKSSVFATRRKPLPAIPMEIGESSPTTRTTRACRIAIAASI